MNKLNTARSLIVVTEVERDLENFWMFREKGGQTKSQSTRPEIASFIGSEFLAPKSSNTRTEFSHPVDKDLSPIWRYAISKANN
jgi:hypothetical protein